MNEVRNKNDLIFEKIGKQRTMLVRNMFLLVLFAILFLCCFIVTGCNDREAMTISEYAEVTTEELSTEEVTTEEVITEELSTEVIIENQEKFEEEYVEEQDLLNIVYESKLKVYSISEFQCIRSNIAKDGDLSDLGEDEYYCFCLDIENASNSIFSSKTSYVMVDGEKATGWAEFSIQPGSSTHLAIKYDIMSKYMMAGTHSVVWYIDEQEVHRDNFVITENMDWDEVFDFPSNEEIENYNSTNQIRSPYIAGWYQMPNAYETRYTEYMVDFKADYLPKGTYCALGNWYMDYSSLEDKYVKVEQDGVSGYAGFQNTVDGMKGILSFWDIICTDAEGNITTIRAERVYPEVSDGNDDFDNEGTGVHCLVPYEWEAGHWYRMHLKCVDSQETGNTIVEQWVCDLETGEWTMLCGYDVGVPDACFKGNICVFLENYLCEYAGDVRSMEVCNGKYLDADTNQWNDLTKMSMYYSEGRYEGSYNFGTEDDRFWMITSGVGGDWYNTGKGKKADYYTIETE